MQTTMTELVDLRAGRKVQLVIFRDEPPRRPLVCGCILAEGEAHYCTARRRRRVVALPPALCPHDEWDQLEDRCARCGVGGEILFAHAVILDGGLLPAMSDNLRPVDAGAER